MVIYKEHELVCAICLMNILYQYMIIFLLEEQSSIIRVYIFLLFSYLKTERLCVRFENGQNMDEINTNVGNKSELKLANIMDIWMEHIYIGNGGEPTTNPPRLNFLTRRKVLKHNFQQISSELVTLVGDGVK